MPRPEKRKDKDTPVIVRLLSLGALLIAVALTSWYVSAFYHRLSASRSQPDGQAEEIETDTAKLKVEPVKKGLRNVGGDGIATPRIEEEQIVRLPSKPLIREAEKSLEALSERKPVRLSLPVIDVAGRVDAGGYRIRIAGIATPSVGQLCGTGEHIWPCGTTARTAMRRFIRNRNLMCILPGTPPNRIVEAQCTVGGKDIAEWMVKRGWAVVADDSPLAETMADARKKFRGMWRRNFDAQAMLAGRLNAQYATSD